MTDVFTTRVEMPRKEFIAILKKCFPRVPKIPEWTEAVLAEARTSSEFAWGDMEVDGCQCPMRAAFPSELPSPVGRGSADFMMDYDHMMSERFNDVWGIVHLT